MGSTPVIQTSFNAGEWAPALNARVDIQKYHSGAALLRNFFVDYRGGATTRPGSKFILPTWSATNATRLIPFVGSFSVTYILEFGEIASQGYIRFFNNGAPVLEAPTSISGITNANPGVITDVGHGYSVGQWIYISGIGGTTQLNGNYYMVTSVTATTFTIADIATGVNIDTTSFGAYTSGGTAQRVYYVHTPYLASDLANIKYAQNVNTLILCHPNYPPYQLVLNSATNWSMTPITFGTTVGTPGSVSVSTTLAAGSVNYAYVVTAVDGNGQESGPSAPGVLASVADIRSVAGSNTISWGAVAGAASYNVYAAEPTYGAAVPTGVPYGFIGNCVGTSMVDSNIQPDFAQGVPVVQNPYAGAGVSSLTLTGYGSGYSSPPAVILTGGAPSTNATAYCYLGVVSISILHGGAAPWSGPGVPSTWLPPPPTTLSLGYGVTVNVTYTGVFNPIYYNPSLGTGYVWTVTGVSLASIGVATGAAPSVLYGPGNPYFFGGDSPQFSVSWGVRYLYLASSGIGYSSAPFVNFIGGGGSGASAVATIGAGGVGNPTVPGFFQQRLVLAGPSKNPQQFNMSQPGSFYNFNINNPIEADDAIEGTLVSGTLNTIQSMIAQPQGLIILSDRQAWLINGGSAGAPVSAIQIVANTQAYNGSANVPPIVCNDHVLYVQSKGSIVRDLAFNFYTQVYTGSDVSVLSSHLFYGYAIREWAWAEEPFKLVWAVRNDGTMLNLTFLREQELVAWAHSDTQGNYKSVASVTEYTANGNVDAVYTVVQRVINGNTVQYIERFADQQYQANLAQSWCVDAGVAYRGSGALSFQGAQHLAGMTVVGIATDSNGVTAALTPFTMPVSGIFTLPAPASGATNYTFVLVGLAYTPQLQTLMLDTGEPTIQGKRKKITAVTLRVKDALGLSIGGDSTTLVPMKDLTVGNVGSATNTLVTDLVTGDARTIIDPKWSVPGQYFIQQSNPFPASILGVIPEITVGDTQK